MFNIFGYTLLGFEQPWLWPLFAVLTAYATDLIFELIHAWAHQPRPRFLGNGARGVYEFLLPAHITALAVNMLLYANNQFWPVLFGVVIAVSQKHFLQAPIAGRMRHFMNPSNFGIATTLLLFGSWVSISPPYMFTEWASSYFRLMIPIIILTSGTVINAMLTKRVPLIVGWLGTFIDPGLRPALALGRPAQHRAQRHDRRGVRALHELHDHRPGHHADQAAGPVHVRQQRGRRLRGPDGIQHRLHALLRHRDRLRGPRPGLVDRLPAAAAERRAPAVAPGPQAPLAEAEGLAIEQSESRHRAATS